MSNSTRYYADAYIRMATEAHYRPAAPGDGFGGIYLDADQLADPSRLQAEALDYAKRFEAEEDTCQFQIGCCDFSNNRAFVYTIEAARLLCSGIGGHEPARKLLMMAEREVEKHLKEQY
jgi:hypothetical protein